jgi:hypothetical protein
VLACFDRLDGMGDAGGRVTGRLDDHLDALVNARVAPMFGKARARDVVRIPANCAACSLGALGIKIGDRYHVEASDRRHLSQKHRAEFARTDEPDTNGLAGGDARGEHGLQIHGFPSAR